MREGMKSRLRIFLYVTLISFSTTTSACADELQNAQTVIDKFLGRDGGGLVSHYNNCEKDADTYDAREYVEDYQIVPIDSISNAMLISTRMCSGGNKHGQYFVIARKGKAEHITNAEIDDMSFIGKIREVSDGVVYFDGVRWLPNDPHCCPSKQGTLEYNIKTKKHKFTLEDYKPPEN